MGLGLLNGTLVISDLTDHGIGQSLIRFLTLSRQQKTSMDKVKLCQEVVLLSNCN